MGFREWLNNLFGCEIDPMDIPEEDYVEFYAEWLKIEPNNTEEV